MEKSIKEILRKIYIENGETIFLNSDKLKGVLADKLYNYPNEKKRLYLAINENIIHRLFSECDETRYKVYARILVDTYAIPYDVASDIIEVFVYAKTGKGSKIDVEEENTKQVTDTTQEKSNVIEKKPEDRESEANKINKVENNQKTVSNQDERYAYSKSTKTTARILLAVIALFLLALPIMNALNTNTNDYNDNYETNGITDADAIENNIIHTIDATYDNDNKVVINNWEVSPQVLDRMVYDCEEFSINMTISDVIDGYPYGTWLVYLRNDRGMWNEVHSFDYESHLDEVTTIVQSVEGYSFEPFDAIILVRASNETSNHSYGYYAYDFVIKN